VDQRLLVENRIRELYNQHGRITPDIVIADAKQENSPLHSQFNWDVNQAAMQAWRETARRIIRGVRILVTYETVSFSPKGKILPEFVRSPDVGGNQQGYARAADLRNDRDRAISALMMEIDRADAAINRARGVAEVLGLGDEIKMVTSVIEKVRDKIKTTG
jgi:hypothetical protein